MSPDLKGLTAVITGAGAGIGRSLALEFAAQGMNVGVLDIREGCAADVARECSGRGVQAVGIGCDVTARDQIQAAAVRVLAELGPPSLLWPNAGVLVHGGITDTDRDALKWIYAVNLEGVIGTVRAFMPAMRTIGGWRHVAITSSLGGLVHPPSPRSSLYCATKYAVIGVAEALRMELQAEEIGVSVICPGIVNTRIWNGEVAKPERFGGPGEKPEAAGELWRNTGMDPDSVAKLALSAVLEGSFYVLVGAAESMTRVATRDEAVHRGWHEYAEISALSQ
jgi:NAD(P)-dependent dehydrogenase (short-subunit alcohol dehydrogenase family)